jgi:putative PIN family toxin of toxin-antitoxin system
MQKVIIDTNVIVSSLIQKSYPYRIIFELFIEDKISLYVSPKIIEEYYEVMERPKFSQYQEFAVKAKMVLANIEKKAVFDTPDTKIELKTDKDDNKFLELADKCAADFIITGDSADFTFSQYKKTKIVTPRDYWDNYRPQ